MTTSALRRAVEAGSADLPRTVAIDALMARDFPFKAASLQAVLTSPDASLGTRLVAIAALAQLAGTASIAALEEANRLGDPRLRQAAILALGRAAGPEWLDKVRGLTTGGSAGERAAASFAALLIACRAGIGPLLPDTPCAFYELERDSSTAVPVRAASEGQIERAVWALGDRGFAVDASPQTALSLDLGDVHWIVALDRRSVEAMRSGASAVGARVLGIISEEDPAEDPEDEGDFDATAVILAEMSDARGRAVAYDLTGQMAHAGRLHRKDGAIELELASVRRPEVAPVEIALSLGPGPRVTARDARIAVGLTRKTRLTAVHAGVATGGSTGPQ